MKVFVLFIMVCLFVLRIKNTKSALSKDAYERKFEEQFHKDEKSFTNKKFVLKTLAIECIIFSICYAFVLFKNYSFILNVLSFIQIITVFMTINVLVTDIIDTDNTKAIYHQNHMIFNVILDYIYYPIVIFMLIFH